MGEVIRGRIRVDASRAVAKLREHQLVDLHHYGHELARAAVASGAKRIDVTYDADDVVVAFDGRGIDAETVPRLLDHVLTEADDPSAQRLRFLAMGVNAALGLDPAFVDVEVRDAQGWVRARWTPSGLADDAEPELERLGPSKRTRHRVRVHVRRRLGWDVVRRAAVGGAPREVGSLVAAAGELRIPLAVNGTLRDSLNATALLAVPLRLSKKLARGLRARLEVLPRAERRPTVVFVERGVVLAEHLLVTEPVLPGDPLEVDGALIRAPVRVVVEADSLPTNASRSAVREDAPLSGAVVEESLAALTEAIRALTAVVTGEGELPTAVTLAEDATAAQLDDALGAFVVLAVAANKAGKASSQEASALLELPLLRTGTDAPLAYASIVDEPGRVWHLHRGEPLPAALAPWMNDVVRVQGRRVEAALRLYEHRDAEELVAHAMEGLDRLEAFMAHAPTEVAVSPEPAHVLVERFEVKGGLFHGLKGEVALRASGADRCTVHVFYEGRELAVQQLPPPVVPLPCDIALAWDGQLQVRLGFDGVEDDRTLRRAIWYAQQVGALAVEEVIERLDAEALSTREADGIRRLVRGAVAARLTGKARLSLPDLTPPVLPEDDPLRVVAAWPTTEPGRFESLHTLRSAMSQGDALCVAPGSAIGGRAVNGRPVLVVGSEERAVLAEALGEITWVPYERYLLSERQARRADAGRDQAVERVLSETLLGRKVVGTLSIRFKRPGARGRVAIAPDAGVTWLHAGKPVGQGLVPRRFGPALIVADDETIVPSPVGESVLWRGQTWSFGSVERELLVAVVGALEGDAQACEALGVEQLDAAALGATGRAYVASSMLAVNEELDAEQENESLAELVHLAATGLGLPLVRMLGADGRPRWVSVDEVTDGHGQNLPIPVLREAPGFPTFDWRPLLFDDDREREAFDRWLGKRLQFATGQLPDRKRRAHRQGRLARLLTQPELDRFTLGPLAPAELPIGRAQGAAGSACVGLAPRADQGAVLDVMFRGRGLFRTPSPTFPLPVVARVSLDESDAFEDFSSLSEAGNKLAAQLIGQAALDLVDGLLEAEEALLDAAVVGLIVALFDAVVVLGIDAKALKQRLRRVAWPTMQGKRSRLSLARRGRGELYVGRTLYVPWREAERGGGALDRPVLYLPQGSVGEGLEAILERLSLPRRDVSAAVRALQMRRGAGIEEEVPRLPGEPSHARLRRDLQLSGLSGELEIVDGLGRLFIGDLSGPVREVSVPLEVPVHAALWTETLPSEERDARIAKRVERAAERLLDELAADLEGLPGFVRRLLRGRVLDPGRDIASDDLPGPLERAAVFLDTEDRWHSLADLKALLERPRQSPVWVTDGAPPFPPREDGRVILRLDEPERMGLRPTIPLRNMTSILERTMRGIEARQAAPTEELRLDEVLRSACLWTARVARGGLVGEVGVLRPGQSGLRGIAAHVGGRFLCRLGDDSGWPIAAVVDDEALSANPYFDAPRRKADGAACVERVRAIADALMREAIAAPDEAAASCWIDEDGLVGRLWLPARCPRSSFVHLLTGAGATDSALVKLVGTPLLDRRLPVQGSLMMDHGGDEDPRQTLTMRAFEAAAQMVNESLSADQSARERQRYRWTMALLGADLDEPPTAKARNPRGEKVTVDAAAVLDELERSASLWVTDGGGFDPEAMPDEAPPILIVEGEDAGLLDVLGMRATRPILRRLGVAGSVPVYEAELPPEQPLPFAATPAPPEEQEELVDPWLSGVVSGLRRWVGVAPESARVSRTLREAIETEIAAMTLPGAPVRKVGFSRRGRALRFQPKERRLVINRDHPAMRALLDDHGPRDEVARALLLAGIASELNAAQEAITGATECSLLLRLLR